MLHTFVSDLSAGPTYRRGAEPEPAIYIGARKKKKKILRDERREGGMASVVRGVFKAIREKGVGNFVKQVREEGYT